MEWQVTDTLSQLLFVNCCQAGMGGNTGFVLLHCLIFPREAGCLDFYVESPDFLKYWIKIFEMLDESI